MPFPGIRVESEKAYGESNALVAKRDWAKPEQAGKRSPMIVTSRHMGNLPILTYIL
jgi:hypothetical protein